VVLLYNVAAMQDEVHYGILLQSRFVLPQKGIICRAERLLHTKQARGMPINTAVSELTRESNTPLTDSTNLQATMLHKSGTAQI